MRKESGMRRMWVNRYKSMVPRVGYYDINCLIEALKLKQCHVSLHAVFNPKVTRGPMYEACREMTQYRCVVVAIHTRKQYSTPRV